MTMTIVIGKLIIKPLDVVIKEKLITDNCSVWCTFKLIDFMAVEQCPSDNDGCTFADTMTPNTPKRTESFKVLDEFFTIVMPEIYEKLKPIYTDRIQIARINTFIKQLREIRYNGNDKIHEKRLQWMEFWCNRAVNLYDNDAVISFY